ncbi:Decapping enzyme Dcp1 [Penicillium sp. IBT 16267x]|nr:Decapping enzyme Dcp1 [Penicillium sp. IBT 16267x]
MKRAPRAPPNRRANHRPDSGYHNYQNNGHTDYESDNAYLSDMPQQPPPPLRSNEELNNRVLRRHNPEITDVISLANYAVIYTFNPASTTWEKTNIEGTLFVCSMTPGPLGEERYTVFLLNRRSLENFESRLTGAENVEVTEEYVILKEDMDKDVESKAGANNYRVYGIWIYSENETSTTDTRTVNAMVIRECATRAGQSLKAAKERIQAMRQNELHIAAAAAETQAIPNENVQGGIQGGVSMGRTMSLKDMFGQQRAQDDEWSVRAHHEQPQVQPQPPTLPGYGYPMPLAQQHAYQTGVSTPPAQGTPDVLGDLFRRAGLQPKPQ